MVLVFFPGKSGRMIVSTLLFLWVVWKCFPIICYIIVLCALKRVENRLANVEQSPSKSMQTALSPCTKALVSDELLRHPDADVKVAVASCISEITRITAPDAPYDDNQMKVL